MTDLPLPCYNPPQAWSIQRFATDRTLLVLAGTKNSTNVQFIRAKCVLSKSEKINNALHQMKSDTSMFFFIAAWIQVNGGTTECWNLYSFVILHVINDRFPLILQSHVYINIERMYTKFRFILTTSFNDYKYSHYINF